MAESGRGRGSSGGSRGARSSVQPTIPGDQYTRPKDLVNKSGTDGRLSTVVANFVRVEAGAAFSLKQYHVMFIPEVDSKKARQALIQTNKQAIGGQEYVFDGMILYSCDPDMPNELSITSPHPNTGLPVEIRISCKVRFAPTDPQAINIYNLMIRRSFTECGYVPVGRNHFNPKESQTVEQYGLEVWPGYQTAVRNHEDGMLLCIENVHKLLRKKTVLQLMCDEYARADNNVQVFRRNVAAAIADSTVITMYNNRLYKVADIMWDMNPQNVFPLASGGEKTYAQYFLEQHNQEIKDMLQPLLMSRGKSGTGEEQAIYLIPELCHLTGLTDAMRGDHRVMRALATFTRLTPAKRISLVRDYLAQVRRNDNMRSIFGQWQFDLGDDLVEFNARELQAEELTGQDRNAYRMAPGQGDWARCIRGQGAVRDPMALHNWVMAVPGNDNYRRQARDLWMELKRQGEAVGMEIHEPVRDEQANFFVDMIRETVKRMAIEGRQPQLVLIIVPNDNKTRYDSVKKLLCLDLPVPSQVVQWKTLDNQKNYSSVVQKVMLQMNCKLGGSLWKVNIPMKDTMIMGYDLYHDSTMRGKTVGAAISSRDKEYTKWFSQCELHSNPTELGENLGIFVERALKKWFADNKELPKRVIIYRDGCGDGQIPFVRNQEISLVKKGFAKVGMELNLSDYQPALAFIIVTKRVNVRFFKKMPNDTFVNPPPGTVVDSVITRPERYDFYMVPQFVSQGTVSPVNYNIIWDETNLGPDKHQKLVFKLCHLYYNWQGTIRVPAPCQYAQKLAFLVAQSLHGSVHRVLEDKLFFL